MLLRGTLLCVVCFSLPFPSPVRAEPGTNTSSLLDPTALTNRPLRHLDYRCECWSVAESPNFRIYHRQKPELAEKAARVAEQTRIAVQRKWFGEMGRDWDSRCEVYLHETQQDFYRATGVPAGVPGRTLTRSEADRVIARRIDLCCADPNCLAAVLPHETTHAVLAGRFGQQPVPPWANEGMAVLDEPQDQINTQLRKLPRLRREGELIQTEKLLALKGYPEQRRLGAFYAQSVSLAGFLAGEKGPETFARFVRDGLRDGYDAALKRYYGWGLQELDGRWRKHAFGEVVAGK